MRRIIVFIMLLVSMSLSSFAKKDINAWKSEKSLNKQYRVFKENLNFWNGSYFLHEQQLDEFYNAVTDSISNLENEVSKKASRINSLGNELDSTKIQLEDTKVELNNSIKNQNAISVFGQNIDKNIYTLIMSMIILSLLVFLGILFLLYKRSIKITARTKQDYDELKNEFEIHKKNALERYTKINMELHHTRLKLNKRD